MRMRLDERHRGGDGAEQLSSAGGLGAVAGCRRGLGRRPAAAAAAAAVAGDGRGAGAASARAPLPSARASSSRRASPGCVATSVARAALEERPPLRRDRLGVLEVLLEQRARVAGVQAVDVMHAHSLCSSSACVPCRERLSEDRVVREHREPRARRRSRAPTNDGRGGEPRVPASHRGRDQREQDRERDHARAAGRRARASSRRARARRAGRRSTRPAVSSRIGVALTRAVPCARGARSGGSAEPCGPRARPAGLRGRRAPRVDAAPAARPRAARARAAPARP